MFNPWAQALWLESQSLSVSDRPIRDRRARAQGLNMLDVAEHALEELLLALGLDWRCSLPKGSLAQAVGAARQRHGSNIEVCLLAVSDPQKSATKSRAGGGRTSRPSSVPASGRASKASKGHLRVSGKLRPSTVDFVKASRGCPHGPFSSATQLLEALGLPTSGREGDALPNAVACTLDDRLVEMCYVSVPHECVCSHAARATGTQLQDSSTQTQEDTSTQTRPGQGCQMKVPIGNGQVFSSIEPRDATCQVEVATKPIACQAEVGAQCFGCQVSPEVQSIECVASPETKNAECMAFAETRNVGSGQAIETIAIGCQTAMIDLRTLERSCGSQTTAAETQTAESQTVHPSSESKSVATLGYTTATETQTPPTVFQPYPRRGHVVRPQPSSRVSADDAMMAEPTILSSRQTGGRPLSAKEARLRRCQSHCLQSAERNRPLSPALRYGLFHAGAPIRAVAFHGTTRDVGCDAVSPQLVEVGVCTDMSDANGKVWFQWAQLLLKLLTQGILLQCRIRNRAAHLQCLQSRRLFSDVLSWSFVTWSLLVFRGGQPSSQVRWCLLTELLCRAVGQQHWHALLMARCRLELQSSAPLPGLFIHRSPNPICSDCGCVLPSWKRVDAWVLPQRTPEAWVLPERAPPKLTRLPQQTPDAWVLPERAPPELTRLPQRTPDAWVLPEQAPPELCRVPVRIGGGFQRTHDTKHMFLDETEFVIGGYNRRMPAQLFRGHKLGEQSLNEVTLYRVLR